MEEKNKQKQDKAEVFNPESEFRERPHPESMSHSFSGVISINSN